MNRKTNLNKFILMKFNKLWLFNTNIVPNEAVVKVTKITINEAKALFNDYKDNYESAIEHEGTAEAFSKLLNSEIKVNRIFANPLKFEIALSLKIKGRINEGEILSLERMEEIGYEFFRMEFYPVNLIYELFENLNPKF